MSSVKTIAILGAGKLGTTLARLALRAGYTVYIAGSGNADKIALSTKIITPGAIAATAIDAIQHSDVVILALPLGNYQTLPVDALSDKLVIDAMNYWWEVDGDSSTLLGDFHSSSEMIQAFLAQSRVTKALSHMGYHHLFDEAKPAGTPGRKAIAIASDNSHDIALVSTIIDALGFDPVPIGSLARGVILEPGHELFGANTTKEKLKTIAQNSH